MPMKINSPEHYTWLEKTSLMDMAKANCLPFQKILRNCLQVKDGEVLIIGDEGFPSHRLATLMALGYHIGARKLGLKSKIVMQRPKTDGQKSEKEGIEAIKDLKQNSIIILNLSGRFGHKGDLGKNYRKFAKERGHRFISATKLGLLGTSQYNSLLSALDVDYARMSKRGIRLKQILDDTEEIHITTNKGTNFHMNIKGKKAIINDGLFSEPGEGGNLPAGEVYIAPRGTNKIKGTIVIDGSITHKEGTTLTKRPVTLEIDNGKVVSIEGGEEAKILEDTLKSADKKTLYSWGIRRIGELGIGINQNARIVGATIIDEKTLGTAHVGIGSNYWFGGTIYASTHFDQVFNNPIIYVDRKLLSIS